VDRTGESVTTKLVRLALVCCGLALLSACNIVLTKDPLFTQKDAAGAPTLKPGVWLFFKDSDCALDEHKPFNEWPDCAGGGLVTLEDIAGHKSNTPGDTLEHAPYVLAAGEPRVMQLQVDVDLSVTADATATGDATVTTKSDSTKAKPYAYAAVHPTKLDDQGRIVAFTLWPVQCGPPPPKNAKGEDTAMATLHPLPGIQMKKGDAVCTTTSPAALHNAAKASQAWADQPREAHWLRDGPR
jgi:hypothetical protein